MKFQNKKEKGIDLFGLIEMIFWVLPREAKTTLCSLIIGKSQSKIGGRGVVELTLILFLLRKSFLLSDLLLRHLF
jgi:hypothetical protein